MIVTGEDILEEATIVDFDITTEPIDILLDNPAAPITPTGKWFVRLAGDSVDRSVSSVFGRIFLGGVLVRPSEDFDNRRPFGPERELRRAGLEGSKDDSSAMLSMETLGLTLMYPVLWEMVILSSESGVSESAGDPSLTYNYHYHEMGALLATETYPWTTHPAKPLRNDLHKTVPFLETLKYPGGFTF